MADKIEVSVAYALPKESFWQTLSVSKGTSARQAIEKSGVLELFDNLVLEDLDIGIFSRPVRLDHVLEAGDRVEIYRPLLVDPKTVPKRSRS